MTVRQLREALAGLDGDALVVLSSDPEGNGYSELDVVEMYTYKDGEIWIRALTPEERERGYTEEDLGPDDAALAAVLWPRW